MTANRGFALIAALWTVTVLAGIVGLTVGAARLGQQTSLNRLALTRGRWAAEACLAIVEARWVQHRLSDTASQSLGRLAHCDWRVSDPTARLNVNAADSGELVAVLCARRGAVCPVGSILARRRQSPLSDLAQMTGVAGVDTAVLRLLTVDGPGSVNVNAASSAVLLSLPGLSPEAAARLAERRALGRPITSLDALVSVLSSAARGMMVAQYADLARQVTFGPPVLLLTTRGWADGVGSAERLVATIEVLLVPLPTRLAVVRRRMW